MSALPPVLAYIASLTSVACAMNLAEAFGGTFIYIPKRPSAGGRLAKCIGLDHARKLASYWGGDRIEMPLARAETRARRDAAIRVLRREGESESTVARRFGTTARNVRRITNGASKNRRTPLRKAGS